MSTLKLASSEIILLQHNLLVWNVGSLNSARCVKGLSENPRLFRIKNVSLTKNKGAIITKDPQCLSLQCSLIRIRLLYLQNLWAYPEEKTNQTKWRDIVCSSQRCWVFSTQQLLKNTRWSRKKQTWFLWLKLQRYFSRQVQVFFFKETFFDQNL